MKYYSVIKSEIKSYILFDSKCMTLWKGLYYRDGKKTND